MTCKHSNITSKFLTGGYSMGVETCTDCGRKRSVQMGCGRAYISKRSKWYSKDQVLEMAKKNLSWIFEEIK